MMQGSDFINFLAIRLFRDLQGPVIRQKGGRSHNKIVSNHIPFIPGCQTDHPTIVGKRGKPKPMAMLNKEKPKKKKT